MRVDGVVVVVVVVVLLLLGRGGCGSGPILGDRPFSGIFGLPLGGQL